MFRYLQIQNQALQQGDNIKSGVAEKLAALITQFFSQIPAWIAGTILLIFTIFAAKIVKSTVEARIQAKVDDEHEEVVILAGRVSYFAALMLGVTIALKVAGIDLTSLLAAVAFGIGFALRDLIMNFLAGVMILVSRQFVIGDTIQIGDTLGIVVEIQTRATILKTFDGTKVIVPNAEIFTHQVTSFTTNPTRRIEIPIGVSFNTNVKYAIKVALDVLKSHPMVLKSPESAVVANDFGDSSINLAVRFWVNSTDPWIRIKSEIIHLLHKGFNDAGVLIPFPVRHIESEDGTREEWTKASKMVAAGLSKMEEEEKTAMQTPSVAQAEASMAPQNGAAPAVANGAAPPQPPPAENITPPAAGPDNEPKEPEAPNKLAPIPIAIDAEQSPPIGV